MGARAAIMAATEQTRHLVLVSYPLHTGKETRDEILLNIDSSVKVIFVSGDKDSMCELARLDEVRKKMRCETWRIVVEGADHGMSLKPKKATAGIGTKTGEVVAAWIKTSNSSRREGRIFCNEEGGAEWTGWSAEDDAPKPDLPSAEAAPRRKAGSKRSRSKQTPDADDSVSARSKRRKT